MTDDECRKPVGPQKWVSTITNSVLVIVAMTFHPLVSPNLTSKMKKRLATLPIQVLIATCLAYSMTKSFGDTAVVLVAYLLFRTTVLQLV